MMAARLSPGELARLSEADRAANFSLYTPLKESALAHLAALKERALLKESAAASAIDHPAAVTPRPVSPVASDMMDTNFACWPPMPPSPTPSPSPLAASAPISLAADSPPVSPTTTSADDRSFRAFLHAPTNSATNKNQFSTYSAAVTDSRSRADSPPASHAPRNFIELMQMRKRRASETSRSVSSGSSAALSTYMDHFP
jgi:hypothetical protein